MSARFPLLEFKEVARLNPFWSSYLCFYEIVRTRNLSKRVLRHYFDTVVDENDYSKKDRNEIIGFLNKVGQA